MTVAGPLRRSNSGLQAPKELSEAERSFGSGSFEAASHANDQELLSLAKATEMILNETPWLHLRVVRAP